MREEFFRQVWVPWRIRSQGDSESLLQHQTTVLEVLEDCLTRPRAEIEAYFKHPCPMWD